MPRYGTNTDLWGIERQGLIPGNSDFAFFNSMVQAIVFFYSSGQKVTYIDWIHL